MELEGVKRVAFWATLFVFVALMGIFGTSENLSVLFRVILIVLLAILASMFRLEDRYSFLSISLAILAGIFIGIMLSTTASNLQLWSFAFIFVVVFFLSCEVFEKNLLKI